MQTTSDREQAVVMPNAASAQSKKEQVAEMFNNIAGKYDLLNHLLSLGIDKTWRKKAIAVVSAIKPAAILDIATGTGDLAIAAARATDAHVTGLDIAVQMLDHGRKKISELGLDKCIAMQQGDSEALPFEANSFDAVMCAYGVRNFENLEAGLREMQRVMRPGGQLAILEFSSPTAFPVKQLYGMYFKYVLPAIGRMVSKHSRAYTYLPESVQAFPDGQRFCDILTKCGFSKANARPLTLGVTTLYTATK
ncbi:bifunctional demethylmenaquinone methyltransferase/2-methoxy-6-polyprenyl-1,4-benzoquinol methylase UbiE [Nemorincola caseinilytica]|uniref:Demethylmenaquinone methyltransferase n=1 Tax=Nemorincola caseinilytica TaxID=2054315 RepID=A0ABP8N6N4_9BACT